MADFTFYGGLYRYVKIIAVNKTHFCLDYYGGSGLMVTPRAEKDGYSVEMEACVANFL
jgi:beta-galactosidase